MFLALPARSWADLKWQIRVELAPPSANHRYLQILLKNPDFRVDHSSEDRWQP
jgi:hypothetical protein